MGAYIVAALLGGFMFIVFFALVMAMREMALRGGDDE